MCEVMKTKSTYCVYNVALLFAWILLLNGVSYESFADDWKIRFTGTNNCTGVTKDVDYDLKKCGDVYYKEITTGSWNNQAVFEIYRNGARVENYSNTDVNQYNSGVFTINDAISGVRYIMVNPVSSNVSTTTVAPQCGPEISDIAGGASILCLNDDAARNALAAPTVTGEESKGWTINGAKNTDLTLDYIKDPANMAALNGATLQYWAEDESHVVALSNEVTLSVCLPEVGSIAGDSAFICLNNRLLRTPTVSGAYATSGWEIVENNVVSSSFVSISGDVGNQMLIDGRGVGMSLSSFYGKDIRYFVADAYGNNVHSNAVKLMSKPTVTIDLIGDENTRTINVCDGEQITHFPFVSYNANGTTIASARWLVYKNGSWVEYKNQVMDETTARIEYRVTPISKQKDGGCGYSSTNDSRTNLNRISATTEIKFTPSLNDSYGCSGHASATVTDISDNVIDGTTYWTKNNAYNAKTDGNTYDFTFDCESEVGTMTLGAYVIDAETGCKSSVSQTISVISDFTTFLYVGGVGESSNVTNANNWELLNADGTTDPSIHPTFDFSSDGCRYVINTNGVELLSSQTWSVSGEGTKIIVGDGTWESLSGRSGAGLNSAFTVNSANAGYGVPSGDFELMSQCSNTDWITNLSNIAKYDYRGKSKKFTISGVLTTDDNVVIDVKAGANLTINTNEGSYNLGLLTQDKIALASPILADGVTNGYSWASIVPGSSVTYMGTGVKKIRKGTYSQLYVASENCEDITFEENALVEIKQSLSVSMAGSCTNKMRDHVKPNGCTILFSGSVNQIIPSLHYYDLVIANASTKSISTNVWIDNMLSVEASSSLNVGATTVSLYGDGENVFVNKGHVFCSNGSTVSYFSNNMTTIAPIFYYNLSLGSKPRRFSPNSVTGIAGSLTGIDASKCTTTGSIVEFNGTGAQTIPSMEYYNLTINNRGLDGSNNSSVSLGGNIVVMNQLLLNEGILNTDSKSLVVKNSSSSAVGQGYRYNADSASYIIGSITRAVPSNLSGTGSESYLYPVGTLDAYLPLSISKITSGSDASITVGTTNAVSSTSVVSPLTSVNTNAYWKIDGTNYTSSSVSVSSSNGLSSCNTLGFKKEGASSFENIVGCSVSDNSICASSIVNGNGIVALANRNINAKTYYLVKAGANPLNKKDWWTNEDGSGEHPSSFYEDDATWVFRSSTSVKMNLTIGGSNTKVYFDMGPDSVLTIKADLTLPIVEHKRGLVKVETDGSLNILNMYTMKDEVSNVSNGNYELQQKLRKNKSRLENNGTVNIYNSTLSLTNSYVENKGNMNFYNTDISLSSTLNQGPNYNEINTDLCHTRFINEGIVRMSNGALTVSNREVHVRNAAGAVWLIDNTSSPSKTVKFNNVEFIANDNDMQYINFECGSSFLVKHSDVDIVYGGQTGQKNGMNGEITVYDGNLLVKCNNGLGDFTIKKDCGAVYLIDTDGSGDGVFMVDGQSGWKMTVEGELYAVGVLNKSNGSGNKFNVADGAQIFVGDIGVTSSSSHSWDFSLDVKSGGTMNYCGNRTSGSDALGKNEGTLNYAGSFYQNSSPSMQGDVGGEGEEYVLYADGTICMADYVEKVNGNIGHIILPVELTMLYGICKNGNVELHWQTASESNNEGFVILRSFDGVNFVEIAEVMGAGTSTGTINYMYVDEDDKTGMVYYKLRQVDFDGKTKESKIVAVQTCGPNAQFAIAEDEITVSFKNPEETNYVVVTSLSGKIVFSKSFKDVAEARIASPRIKGVYIISVIDSKQITSEKFIK